MQYLIKHKLLSIPLIIWGLQLLYVALALGLLFLLVSRYRDRASHLRFQVLYVLVMLLIDIVWRIAIKRLKPGWF